jgi:hypothetical protein
MTAMSFTMQGHPRDMAVALLDIMSFEQLAVRRVDEFASPIDDDSLRSAIQAVFPGTPLGELESIKLLPGMVNASADTLLWRGARDLEFAAPDG